MSPLPLATIGHGPTALWYLTRATGIVSLVLLSGTLVLGMMASAGWTTHRWPRFLSRSLHRNLSLLCIVLVVVHVVTTVADGYVPIDYLDAVVPFRTPYRTLWVGLGALSFDLLIALAVTSGLRRRIGAQAWRAVHWLAYLCWPIAVIHGLGAGSDTRVPGALLIGLACVAGVLGTGLWRLAVGSAESRPGVPGAGRRPMGTNWSNDGTPLAPSRTSRAVPGPTRLPLPTSPPVRSRTGGTGTR